MSDEEETPESRFVTQQILSKKRKVQRACDICRRKKIRCDGGEMPSNRCSNCITYDYTCTYVENAKKRGPPKGYVENLETRVEKLQALLHRIVPGADFTKDLDSAEFQLAKGSVADHAAVLIRRSAEGLEGYTGGEHDSILLPDTMNARHDLDGNLRFFGKSSGAMFVKQALDLKMQYTGSAPIMTKTSLGTARPEFWHTQPWEQSFTPAALQHRFSFPEEDLMHELVRQYFQNVNVYLPFLHRPTMEKLVEDKLYLTNDSFASVLLLICAVASRYTEDPRVFLENVDSPHSRGWKWFDQVQLVRKSLLSPPSLYDLQTYCLSVQFLGGTSAPQACWTMVGIGIRLAQDVGAHRSKTYSQPSRTIEDELWKRAWWALVSMDRTSSSALGRPCVAQDEDYDIGLPTDCDDEYWDHPDPEKAWKQPAGVPSKVSHFIQYLKLNTILFLALRTLYCIDKSKVTFGLDDTDFELKVVTELDSALNKWVDSIPDHLRWNPKNENELWRNQSIVLYSHYYHLQILIHRPFIPSPKKASRLAFPSLAICTNAARSCSHLIDVERTNCHSLMMQVQMPVFTSAVVLLLNIWGGKKAGLTTDAAKEMKDVFRCMDMLRVCERSWQSAGRLWDILYELASVGDLPLPKGSPLSSNKRARDSDDPLFSPSSQTPSASSPEEGSGGSGGSGGSQRPIKSNRRLMNMSSPSSASSSTLGTPASSHMSIPGPAQPSTNGYDQYHVGADAAGSLPLYSDDLARMPLYGNQDASQYYMNQIYESSGLGSESQPGGTQPNSYQNQKWPYQNQSASSSSSASTSTTLSPSHQYMSGSGDVHDPSLYDLQTMPAPTQDYGVQDHHPGNGGAGFPDYAGSQGVQQAQQLMSNQDLLAVWSSAPMGFELDDWGTYISNVSEIQMSSSFDQSMRMSERQQ